MPRDFDAYAHAAGAILHDGWCPWLLGLARCRCSARENVETVADLVRAWQIANAHAVALAEWRGCLIGQAMALERIADSDEAHGHDDAAAVLREEAAQLRRWATEAR